MFCTILMGAQQGQRRKHFLMVLDLIPLQPTKHNSWYQAAMSLVGRNSPCSQQVGGKAKVAMKKHGACLY